MTKYELLTMLYSLEALIEKGLNEEALEVIRKVIAQAEK